MDVLISLGGLRISLPMLIVWIVCAAFACLTVPVYFCALRPKKGTIEWMKRVDPPHFAPPKIARLQWTDVAWVAIAAVCAVGLRFVRLFFWLGFDRRADRARLLSAASSYILGQLIPCALLAVALFLLLRCLFGKPLPAVCGAICGALVQNSALWSAAALTIALLFLCFWMCAPADRPMPHALWLPLSVAALGFAMLRCRAAAWLAPLWAAAYLYTQIHRWRYGDPDRRGGRLAWSLLLTALLCALGTVLLGAAYVNCSARMTEGFGVLSSFRFYRALLPTMGEKLAELVALPESFWDIASVSDFFLFMNGVAALICTLHGAFRLRESRCLMLLALLAAFTAAWLLGGAYLMTVPMLLLLGWTWKICAERGYAFFVVLSAAVAVLYCGAVLFIR